LRWALGQAQPMSTGRVIGLGVLGAVIGAIAGGALGLGGGLAYTDLANTSGFEGYSGYVVALWMLAGSVVGLLGGSIYGASKGRS
jgi:hypothetical protein